MNEQDDMTIKDKEQESNSASRDGKPNNGLTKSTSSKTEKTIEQLSDLLNSSQAAEELASSWYRQPTLKYKTDNIYLSPSSSSLKSQNIIPAPKLSDLHTVLNSGRSITRGTKGDRGIPLWIIVRMCKASWHLDGTWPLIGCDEEEEEENEKSNGTLSVLQDQQGRSAQGNWKSIHPSNQILKSLNLLASNSNSHNNNKNVSIKESGPPIRNEPTADQIADAYRKRGIFVEDVTPNQIQEDDW